MAKEAIVLKGKIELKNIEIREYCMLDFLTGEKIFYKKDLQAYTLMINKIFLQYTLLKMVL